MAHRSLVTDHRLTRALAERHLSGDRQAPCCWMNIGWWPPADHGERGISCTPGAWEVAVANSCGFSVGSGCSRIPAASASAHLHHPPDQSLCRRAARWATGSPRLGETTPWTRWLRRDAYQPEVLTTYPLSCAAGQTGNAPLGTSRRAGSARLPKPCPRMSGIWPAPSGTCR